MSEQDKNKEYENYIKKLEEQIKTQDNPENPLKTNVIKPHSKKRKKRLFIVIRVYTLRIIALIIALSLVVGIILLLRSCTKKEKDSKSETYVFDIQKSSETKVEEKRDYSIRLTENTVILDDTFFKKDVKYGSGLMSKSVLFINSQSGEVIAERNSDKRCFPASTTKIMTLLVAAEHITDFNDTFKITYEITDPLYREGATVAGFSAGEEVNMKDLLYGTILPSGGDAAIGLAIKIAGSEQAFCELMNKKAEELGLKNTHFTNCTGLFNENHYTTAQDLSVILRAAMDNKLCKEVLSSYRYTTSKTDKHPEGLPLENTLFKYMYGDEPETAVIKGGKTGFVNESGYCIASFGESLTGNSYVCITLEGQTRWPAVYDQINLYANFAK